MVSLRNRQDAAENFSLTLGSYLLIVLTAFFCGELLMFLWRDWPFHIFLALCLLVSGLTGFFASGKLPENLAKRVQCWVWVLILISSAVFTLHNRLPISTVSVTLRRLAEPTDFVLRQRFSSHRKDQLRMKPVEPSRHPVTINLKLPVALRNKSAPLEIYFGQAPNSFDILRISYGTRVLFQPVALHTFSGKSLLHIAGTTNALNSFAMVDGMARLSSKGRSRPMLHVVSDEDYIRRNTPDYRVYAIKLLWFLLDTVMSALILRNRRMDWLKIPRSQAVMRYLTQ